MEKPIEESEALRNYHAQAQHHGRKQHADTMKSILSLKTPAEINFEMEGLEEMSIVCLAHHIVNHGFGSHYSSKTPFGEWNASQAFVKEQEIIERMMTHVKFIKDQYYKNQGRVTKIDPNFKGNTNENSSKQQ